MSPRTPRVRRSTRSSFLKTVFMAVGLLFVLVIMFGLQRQGLPGALGELFSEQDGPAVYGGDHVVLGEDVSTALLQRLAGFWSVSFEFGDTMMLLKGSDRVELKDNGIIWRLTRYTVHRPGNDTLRFQRTLDAYLRPFGWLRARDSVLTCDVRVLRQAIIAGNDTCFGPGNQDVIWRLPIIEGRPSFCSTLVYETHKEDLQSFFPPDAIAMLERAYRGERIDGASASYTIGDKEVTVRRPPADGRGTLSLEMRSCVDAHTPAGYARAVFGDDAAGGFGAMPLLQYLSDLAVKDPRH